MSAFMVLCHPRIFFDIKSTSSSAFVWSSESKIEDDAIGFEELGELEIKDVNVDQTYGDLPMMALIIPLAIVATRQMPSHANGNLLFYWPTSIHDFYPSSTLLIQQLSPHDY
ncbi:uncharacterized protein MELLADRAFT_110752 [Melampsora larici-populina 98AG31]|uniref:Uncharacterized protein n=1 Tax=Melampsora larici-populina (strain 98AG31 / pathotype 3-4-7) TaxID=747676 RepID=F4S0U3_MELLP|nr:uncharacterized protein MELLADRAFT_110752 [Melampsora larici-populina 98AG31]EGG01647.1 hypothetical protein MELLADRAFT_110752 [Melampsora larici-populina 98AG31]